MLWVSIDKSTVPGNSDVSKLKGWNEGGSTLCGENPQDF